MFQLWVHFSFSWLPMPPFPSSENRGPGQPSPAFYAREGLSIVRSFIRLAVSVGGVGWQKFRFSSWDVWISGIKSCLPFARYVAASLAASVCTWSVCVMSLFLSWSLRWHWAWVSLEAAPVQEGCIGQVILEIEMHRQYCWEINNPLTTYSFCTFLDFLHFFLEYCTYCFVLDAWILDIALFIF